MHAAKGIHPFGIVLPAAGASSRMHGQDKLMQLVDNQPLIQRQVRSALTLNLPVLVTLPAHNSPRLTALEHMKELHIRQVTDAGTGLSASLRTAANWAIDLNLNALMVMLPDMPDIRADDLQIMRDFYDRNPDYVCRATDETGKPGHPVILPRRLFSKLSCLQGDQGARSLLEKEKPLFLKLDERHATTDLDTPEDWKTWRQNRP